MLQRLLSHSVKSVTASSSETLSVAKLKKKKDQRQVHKALTIDLILSEILSYLSTPELRRVELVCKRWSRLCGQFRHTRKTWFHNMGPSTERAKEFANTDILTCHFSKYLRGPIDPTAWVLFWRTLSQARRRDQLRRLEFTEEVDIAAHVMPILTEVSGWLTCLTVNANVARKTDIQTMVETLPRLRQLHLSGAVLSKKTDDAILPLCRLKHLELDNCHVPHGFMDELLDACPQLGFLQLTSMFSINTSGRGRNHPMDVLSLVKRRCPTANPLLDEVFLETSYSYEMLRALQEMPQFLKRATKFKYRVHAQSYWKTYTTVSLEHLTRLEIKGKYFKCDFPVEVLHAYLRHDDARHLRELIALDLMYPEEYLNPLEKEQHGCWSSRHLVVLHMGFAPENGIQIQKLQQLYACNLIGYITTMCPRLTDLWIRRKELDFSLAGGLCYLTRLAWLRTLKIQTVDVPEVTEHDLVWLLPQKSLQQSFSPLSLFSSATWRSIGSRGGRKKNKGGQITADSFRTMEKVCREIEDDFAGLLGTTPESKESKSEGISDGNRDSKRLGQQEEESVQDEDEESGDQSSKQGSNRGLAQLQSLTIQYSTERYLGRRNDGQGDVTEPFGAIVKRIRPGLEVDVHFHTWEEREYNFP